MNTKTFIILAGSLIAVIIVVVLAFALRGTKKSTLNIKTNSGQTVKTNDIVTPAPIKYQAQSEFYYDSNLAMTYDNNLNYFQITIVSGDRSALKSLRAQAEQIFLSKLGISQSDACKLNVQETIAASPALNLTNYNFPLSFCGNQIDNFPGN